MTQTTGHCVCGQVTVTGAGKITKSDACHCAMCRRQNGGGALYSTHFENGVTISGKSLTWYASSDYAERSFCANCGSTIAWRMQGLESDTSVSLGLFDQPTARIGSRIFVDEAETYADLPCDVPHLTGAEVIAQFQARIAEKADV